MNTAFLRDIAKLNDLAEMVERFLVKRGGQSSNLGRRTLFSFPSSRSLYSHLYLFFSVTKNGLSKVFHSLLEYQILNKIFVFNHLLLGGCSSRLA